MTKNWQMKNCWNFKRKDRNQYQTQQMTRTGSCPGLNVKHLCEMLHCDRQCCNDCREMWLSFWKGIWDECSFAECLSPYEELYNKKVCDIRQSSILLYFKPSTSATADDKPQLLTSRQADVEGIHISDLPALMNSEDNEMSIDNSLLLFLHPALLCLLPPQLLMTQPSTPSLPHLCLPVCSLSSQFW